MYIVCKCAAAIKHVTLYRSYQLFSLRFLRNLLHSRLSLLRLHRFISHVLSSAEHLLAILLRLCLRYSLFVQRFLRIHTSKHAYVCMYLNLLHGSGSSSSHWVHMYRSLLMVRVCSSPAYDVIDTQITACCHILTTTGC